MIQIDLKITVESQWKYRYEYDVYVVRTILMAVSRVIETPR